MTGDRDEKRWRDAWMDAALEEHVGGAPDVAMEVVARVPEDHRPPGEPPASRRTTVGLLMLGVAAAALILFWPSLFAGPVGSNGGLNGGRAAVGAQDPQEPEGVVDIQVRSLAEFLELVKDLESVTLTAHRKSEAHIILANGTEVTSSRWVPIPHLTEHLVLTELQFGMNSVLPRGAVPDPVMLDLQLSGSRRIRGYLGEGARPVFGTVTLPSLVHIDLTPMQDALARIRERRKAEFASVDSKAKLEAVSPKVHHLVCEGLGDGDLEALGRMRELRSLVLKTMPGDWQSILPRQGRGVEPVEPAVLTERSLAPLARLSKLRTLSVEGGVLSDAMLERLAVLPRLEELSLRPDSVSGPISRGLSALAQRGRPWRRLEISRMAPDQDVDVMALRGIEADHLQIDFAVDEKVGPHLPPDFLAGLDVRVLELGGLRFGRQDLTVPPEAPLHRSLETLTLRNCGRVSLRGIERYLALHKLSMERCDLGKDALQMLQGARIRHLEMVHCDPMSPPNLEAVFASPLLRVLKLWGRDRSVSPMLLSRHLGGAPRLEVLELVAVGTPSDVLVREAAKWRQLRTLDLRSQRVPIEFHSQLMAALPDCQVVLPTAAWGR